MRHREVSDEKKTKVKIEQGVGKGTVDLSASVSIMKFDIDMLDKLTSGSCVISSTIPAANKQPEKVAVCKEGNTIKIFKIVEEKKT